MVIGPPSIISWSKKKNPARSQGQLRKIRKDRIESFKGGHLGNCEMYWT